MADAEQDLKIPDENALADDAQNLLGDETDKLGEGVADAPAPDIVSDAPDAVSDAPEKLVEAAPKMAAADGDAATQTPAVGEAFEQLAEAFMQVVHAVPIWMSVLLVVVFAIGIGVLFGMMISRRGGAAPKTHAPLPTPRPALPAPESPAMTAYREFLEAKDVSASDQDSRLRDFAQAFKDMRQGLRDLTPGNTGLEARAEDARVALEAGKFTETLNIRHAIGDAEHADGVEARAAALKSLIAAATAKTVAGDLHMAHMDYTAATEQFEQAADTLPPGNDEALAEVLNKHGTAAYQAGEHVLAIASFEQSLDLLQRHLGKNHPDVAAALNNLALLHYSRGQYEAAEPLYQRSLAIDEQTLGSDHPGVATDLNNLALLYKKTGNLEAAEPLLKRSLEIKEKNYDPGHPSLVTGLKNYASVLRALGRDDEAAPYESRATTLPPARNRAAE